MILLFMDKSIRRYTMEKTLKPILLLFLFLIVSTGMKAQSEITEEALQKADSLLIEKYKREQLRVQRLQKEHPEWKDSLRAVSRQLQKNFMDDNALQTISSPSTPYPVCPSHSTLTILPLCF